MYLWKTAIAPIFQVSLFNSFTINDSSIVNFIVTEIYYSIYPESAIISTIGTLFQK